MQELEVAEYAGHGIEFRYPAAWTVADDSPEVGVSMTVQSDGTAFWSVAVFPDAPAPEAVLESSLEAYRDDFPEADIYPVRAQPGPQGPELACEVEFVCFELIAAAQLRCFAAGGSTVLVLSQGTDAELDDYRPLLDAMNASLRVTATAPDDWPKGGDWPEGLFGL